MKTPKPFMFFFWRKFKNNPNRIKWKLIYNKEEYIVDSIKLYVVAETHRRNKNPRAVIKGKGILRIEFYKEGTFKKARAILE